MLPGHRRRGGTTAYLALALSPLCCLAASASTFDESGRLSLEGSAFSISLDERASVPAGFDLTLYDGNYTPLGPPQVNALFEENAKGLEGEGALRFGGEHIYGTLSLQGLDDTLDGRRIEMRLWQRPEGARASLDIYFYGGNFAAAFATGNYDNIWYAGMVSFRPTGKITSDGWEEWSTGAFDVPASGAFRPAVINFYDQQLKLFQQSYYAGYEPDASVRLDALEIVDVGPALVPEASCTLVTEPEVCGGFGTCLYGRCADATVVMGAPPHESMREDYLERRRFELETFSGGRLPQQRMANLEAALAPLVDDAPPARFWPTIRAAIADLRDGHASAPWAGYPAQSFVGVCAHLGQADLLPEGGALPLVFETSSANPIASALDVGDAITAIDGLPPAAWARLADRLIQHPGDPEGFDVVTAPALLEAAAVTGAQVEFSRCASDAATPVSCTEEETERFTLDFAELLGDAMWSANPPSWRDDYMECDYRFVRPVVDPNNRSGDFAGYADEDGIRSLLINAVPALYGDEGELWGLKVREALTPAPEKLVFDQRLGHGGSVDAVDLLAGLLVDPANFSHMAMLPALDRELDFSLMDTLDGCAQEGIAEFGCGAYFPWVLGETIVDEGAASSSKVAILIGSDVSGNDFTTKLLSYRSAPTRIFGAAPTWGAFGVIWTLPAWQEELSGGSFQVHDTLFVDGQGQDTGFTTGVGVPPDELVLQTQSDALLGRDTVLEAARAWLNQEGTP